MFLNGSIHHTCQDWKQIFPQNIVLQKRELPYISFFTLSFLNKVLFRKTLSLERTSSDGSFLSYKGQLAKSGETVKTFINYSWGYDHGEQALEIIISKLLTKVLERGIQDLFVEIVNMQGKKTHLSQCLTNGSWDAVKSPLTASYSIQNLFYLK